MTTPSVEPAETVSAPAFDARFLLEMIVCDAHWCALHIATLAILLTAHARPGTTGNLRSCRHLLHDDARTMQLALRYGDEVGMAPDEVDGLSRLYRAMSEAQVQLLPLTRPPVLNESQRQALRNQSSVWRRLASDAVTRLNQLGGAAKARLDRNYAEDAETLRQFLKRAADGDLRDVDASGFIQFPELKQKFRSRD